MINFKIDKYFGFLTKEMDFKGPFKYTYGREVYTDFVKENIVLSICFEGDFWVNVHKTKMILPELETGEIKIIDVSYKDKIGLAFNRLDRNEKIWNSVSGDNFPDKKLWYYYKLISLNPEVLEGDFSKTEFWYRIKQFFRR